MIADNNRPKANRIPVRFVEEEESLTTKAEESREQDTPVARQNDETELTPEELGRASSYEGETEMQRRINRGDEEDAGRADETDTAGGPPLSETPEHREDQDESGAGPKRPGVTTDDNNGPGAQTRTASSPTAAAAAGPMMAELVATRAELKRIEAERADLLDKLARRQADFENYRKRLERERGEMYTRTVGDIVSKLLPVLDNLRRAVDAEASVEASESEEFRRFLHGVELIDKQLNDVLGGLGLQPVEAVGQLFDPHVHEAVATESSDEYEPDTVVQELARGYRLGERLLRPAMVKVATKE
ncbi:MAG TPA: nucleotide exchange factor GrpE [Pyrinomonadaceae bacterium]|jgi:molecular chaperone GrpE|nr:nucleotide exchange factor GrpE [Pyrinomonadaceae bacterium]